MTICNCICETTGCDSVSADGELVIALFHERCAVHWVDIKVFIVRNPQAAPELLAKFASGSRRRLRDEPDNFLADTSPLVIGEFVDLLFEHYPPNQDPQYDGAHFVSPADEARSLRDRLLNWLSDPQDEEDQAHAEQRVTALRCLEAKYGSRFAWLRRPRARAEREYRLRHRKAIPVKTVAEILYSADKRLIRHDTDALDGVVAAVESIEDEVRGSGQSLRERYWNTPNGQTPSPRNEEFYTDEIGRAICRYFASYGVVADREVQLFRRQVSTNDGGQPGSIVDDLVTVQSRNTMTDTAIVVPIEVKRSCNPEALTGMRTQLVDRYLDQAGAAIGVYVVVWLDAASLKKSHRPRWKSIKDAQEDLNRQADELRDDENLDLRVVVIDLSLR